MIDCIRLKELVQNVIDLDPMARGISDLKVGDEVLLRTTWMSSRDKTHHKVAKITKTGKIRLDNNKLYNSIGIRREPGWGLMILIKEVVA
jgi:tartrate dehydratase beta subunit/fumarate hydratase class I family protein